jgi:hypothetical protein
MSMANIEKGLAQMKDALTALQSRLSSCPV